LLGLTMRHDLAEAKVYAGVWFVLLAAVAGVLAAVRWQGTRLQHRQSLDDTTPARLRFTLGDVLFGMFAAAALCWLGQFMRADGNPGELTILLIAKIAFVGLLQAAVSLISMWGCLGAGPWWIRAAAMLMIAPALGLLPPLFAAVDDQTMLAWVALALIQSLVVAVSLFIVRLSGYRLARQ
jgi:hypothetical protein